MADNSLITKAQLRQSVEAVLGASSGNIYVSDEPPANPKPNDIWVDTDDETDVFYNKTETDALLAGKAPAGYGYGNRLPEISAESASEANDVFCAKIDQYIAETDNRKTRQVIMTPPWAYNPGCYLTTIYRYNEHYVVVEATSSYKINSPFRWRIVKETGAWKPVEWLNPPMAPNIEYRTTEQINGKAVYKKNIDGAIHYRLEDETEWKPYANAVNALPIDGSTQMTGSLKIKERGEIDALDTLTYVKAIKDINNFRYLRIINPLLTDYTVAKCIQWGNVIDASEKTYDIYGGHNKPGASYTGNGSATSRTIDTAGIGYGLLIWSVNGWAFVNPKGAVCGNGTTLSALGGGSVYFTGGKLTLITTDNKLNANGTVYNYQVL